jgi:hypothetical protein
MGEASLIQALKATMQVGTNWTQLQADQQLALELICLKAGRILTGAPDHIDNWIDIAGYSTLVADRLKEGGVKTGEIGELAEEPLYKRDTLNEAKRSIPRERGESTGLDRRGHAEAARPG